MLWLDRRENEGRVEECNLVNQTCAAAQPCKMSNPWWYCVGSSGGEVFSNLSLLGRVFTEVVHPVRSRFNTHHSHNKILQHREN